MVSIHHIKSAILLFTLFASGGCVKKEEPILEDGTPVFRIIGLMENTPIKLEAGIDDYYMNTNYNMDTSNVFRFEGDMKRTCFNCKESLRIIIRNSKEGADPIDPDSALGAGEYFYSYQASTGPALFRLTLDADPKGTGTVSHLWTFGDGTTSTLANPIKVLKTGIDYNISYTASFSSGCSSTLTFPIGLDPDFIPTIPVSFSYFADTSTQDTFYFTASADTAGAFLLWEFGDGGTALGITTSHTYSTPGEYKVTLTHITSQDTIIVAKNISALFSNGCTANFNFDKQAILNPLKLSTVVVEWTDANGIVYSSNDNPQNDPESSFIITDAYPYMLNEKGQKTRALDIIFTCTVSNGTKQIKLSNMSAHIAVAYP
jgi:hypothetical protein